MESQNPIFGLKNFIPPLLSKLCPGGGRLALAQDIAVSEPRLIAGDAADALEARDDLEAPGVVDMHDHVHGAQIVDLRRNLGAPDEGQGAEVALRLLDQGRVVAVADREEQLAPDDSVARLDVDAVSDPIEQFVLGGNSRAEDVVRLDLDRGDDKSRRQANRRARRRRERCRMQAEQQGQSTQKNLDNAQRCASLTVKRLSSARDGRS